MVVSAQFAQQWAPKQTSVGAHNGPQDALRHAMWNAQMARRMGSERAEAWANAHELSSTNTAETTMDLHNNEAGRWAARSFDDLQTGVLWLWHNGYLRTGLGTQ
jgi:hypothetical protein